MNGCGSCCNSDLFGQDNSGIYTAEYELCWQFQEGVEQNFLAASFIYCHYAGSYVIRVL